MPLKGADDMSIAYFPTIFEDELIYSVLARFYVHSGSMSMEYVNKEIFISARQGKLDKEFIKPLKQEVVELLTKNMTIEELLEKHTMFPCYGRFLDDERRNRGYQALLSMDGNFYLLFGKPQTKQEEERVMKYCPMCCLEDRKQHGETYWHRVHQIRGITVCGKHKCYLKSSSLSMDSRVTTGFVTADETVGSDKELNDMIELCDNFKLIKLANYIEEVFQKPMKLKDCVMVGKLLHYKMMGTQYVTVRGEHIFLHKLLEDLQKNYQEVPEVMDLTAMQLQRLLRGERIFFWEICMVAMFLGISVEEVSELEDVKLPQQIFDERVQELRQQGLGLYDIARQMGATYSTIKMALNTTEWDKKGKRPHVEYSRAKKDWSDLDSQTLPLVKQAIRVLNGAEGSRPRKVSRYAVSKYVNIVDSKLKRMPKCSKEIEDNMECMEQFHARKLIWAINDLQVRGKDIKLWRIIQIYKMKEQHVYACLPYLEQMAPEVLDIVKSIL